MEKICAVCAKKSSRGRVLVKLRGKFNPTSLVRRYPNLQWTRLPNGKRVLACTKCIKKMSNV